MSEGNEQPKREPKPKRDGQLIRRGPEKFLLRVFLGRDTTGKRHYHNETFTGKRSKAEARLRELLTKRQTGEPLKISADTLGAFLDEWLAARSVREGTRASYAHMLDLYVRPHLGARLLAKITAEDIQALYTNLRAEVGLSDSTIRYLHTLLSGVFRLALRRRRLAYNPMSGLDGPDAKQLAEELRERREARTMSPAQVSAFLRAAAETRWGVFFRLAFFTGCRPGELLALRWDDFDAAQQTLTIRHTIHWRKGSEWYLTRPKTAAGKRTLLLTTEQVELLAAQRKAQLEERMKMARVWRDHNFIFTNELGEPRSQRHVVYYFKKCLKAAGLPLNFNPYTARHTAATLLIGSGVNTKTVSARMGHSDVRITLQAYTHPTDEMQRAASEEIQRLLGGRK